MEATLADGIIARSERTDYYVYVLFRETGEPFYVGKGAGPRIKLTTRLRNGRNPWKNHIIARMLLLGMAVPAIKIAEGLSEPDAYRIEMAFIAAIGRHPLGPLVNQTAGGDGGRSPDADVRAKISASKKGGKHTDQARANMSAAHLGLPGRPQTAESRAKLSAAHTGKKGRHPTAETLLKMRMAQLGKKQPPDAIAKTATANRGRKRSPEAIANMRTAGLRRRGTKKSPESVEKSAAAMRGRKIPPDIIAKRAAARMRNRAVRLADHLAAAD